MTFDEQLRRACAQSADVLGSAAPEEGADHAFSHGFDRRARGLGFRAEHPYARAALHRAAMFFLAIILSTGTFLAADAEARAAFFGWVRNVYEDRIVYEFDNTAAEGDLPVYKLGWLPDGFELHDSANLHGAYDYYYVSSTGNSSFDFACSRMDVGMSIIYLAEADEYVHEYVTVNGIDGEFYQTTEPGGTNNLIWIDEEQQLVFTIDSNLEKDVIMHIAESIYLANSPN